MTARLFKDVTAGDVHSPGAMTRDPQPRIPGAAKKPRGRATMFGNVITPASPKIAATDGGSLGKADWRLPVQVAKTDEDKNLVFGWANVVEKDGATVVDSQDDTIDADELEKAAYDFVLYSREAGEMHERSIGVGKLVESVMMTAEKQAAMGIAKGATPIGWWVGFKLEPDVFKLVKSGKYPMFSIGGKGRRVKS